VLEVNESLGYEGVVKCIPLVIVCITSCEGEGARDASCADGERVPEGGCL
jgi:hypothetical protein